MVKLDRQGSMQERDLLLAVASGDERAFENLFHEFQGFVYSVATKLLPGTSFPEEIVQDVFCKIWQKRSLLQEVESFRPYLYKVTVNTIFSFLRKEATRKKHQLQFQRQLTEADTADWDVVLAKEFGSILQEAVRQLPEKQMKTYLLIKEEGLRRDQVAQQLSVSPETVKTNLEQAMRRIRAYCITHLKCWWVSLLVIFS